MRAGLDIHTVCEPIPWLHDRQPGAWTSVAAFRPAEHAAQSSARICVAPRSLRRRPHWFVAVARTLASHIPRTLHVAVLWAARFWPYGNGRSGKLDLGTRIPGILIFMRCARFWTQTEFPKLSIGSIARDTRRQSCSAHGTILCLCRGSSNQVPS